VCFTFHFHEKEVKRKAAIACLATVMLVLRNITPVHSNIYSCLPKTTEAIPKVYGRFSYTQTNIDHIIQ
jgi:hypothetical protein